MMSDDVVGLENLWRKLKLQLEFICQGDKTSNTNLCYLSLQLLIGPFFDQREGVLTC